MWHDVDLVPAGRGFARARETEASAQVMCGVGTALTDNCSKDSESKKSSRNDKQTDLPYAAKKTFVVKKTF